MRISIYTTLLTLAVTASWGRAHAQDQDLSLVINPLTGAASIRNDTNSSVSIDGYLLTSPGSVFNPATWSTLTANPGYFGWAQGPAAPNRLGEANLFSSLALAGGASLGIGTPYLPFSPTQIGQVPPGLKFEYSVGGVGSVEGDVVFAPQNNVVLIVNPATGAASLQNQSNFNVNIDGLLITSTSHVLDPVGWNGLAESGSAGWSTGAAATNRLGEGKLLGSTLLAANGTPIPIGSPINPTAIGDETDLKFEYHVANVASITGGVVFAAAATPTVTGDYNSDGVVNAADYTVWRDRLGQSFTLHGQNPAATTPGLVDQEDYNFWKSRFGATAGSGGAAGGGSLASSSVPEPNSVLIGLATALCLGTCRSGHRRRFVECHCNE